MDILLRIIAITIEVSILASMIAVLMTALRLTAFDLGLGKKYNQALVMVLIMAGGLVVVFFIAHLASFYPSLQPG